MAFAHTKGLKVISITGYTQEAAHATKAWRINLGKLRAAASAKYLKSLDKTLTITTKGKGLTNKGRIAVVVVEDGTPQG